MSHPAIPIPDPRGYVDYRLFLADAIFARWGQIEDGAHLDFAQAASCTESHIVNILEGRRDLQDDLIDGFVTALGLEGDRRTALLLLVQRADPACVVDPEELELALMALRADWVDERDQAAARTAPVPVEPHPAVAAYRQDEHSADPDPAIAVGLLEALALIKAEGKLKRDYRYGLWTIHRAGWDGLVAILDAGASEMQAFFHQCAAEGSPLARRYAWQGQLALATEPAPEGEEGGEPRIVAVPTTKPVPEGEEGAAPAEDVEEDEGHPAGTPPSVFDFLSDRLYLAAWVAARKVKVPGFTVGRLAVRAQVSASYIYQIL